jgi:hypothetical protein
MAIMPPTRPKMAKELFYFRMMRKYFFGADAVRLGAIGEMEIRSGHKNLKCGFKIGCKGT